MTLDFAVEVVFRSANVGKDKPVQEMNAELILHTELHRETLSNRFWFRVSLKCVPVKLTLSAVPHEFKSLLVRVAAPVPQPYQTVSNPRQNGFILIIY